MKIEAQEIALAEALGFKVTEDSPRVILHTNGTFSPVPAYYKDLNAIHEAEKKLIGPAERWKYRIQLQRVVGTPGLESFQEVTATAPQRLEALLRNFGKWEN